MSGLQLLFWKNSILSFIIQHSIEAENDFVSLKMYDKYFSLIISQLFRLSVYMILIPFYLIVISYVTWRDNRVTNFFY